MTVWREISDDLVHQIDKGGLAPGAQLPTDEELSKRYSVNRHTVRRALTYLAGVGLVRSERGRGTFVAEGALLYRLGSKIRFEENLIANSRVPNRRLLYYAETAPPEAIAAALGLKKGQLAILATLLGEANGVPIHVWQTYFPTPRFPKAKAALAALQTEGNTSLTLTEFLDALGTGEHKREQVRLRTRLPTATEASQLKMAKTEPVLEFDVLNVDSAGKPVYFGVTVACGSRIDVVLDL